MRKVASVHEAALDDSADSFVAMLNQTGEDDILSMADEHVDAHDQSDFSLVGSADDSQVLEHVASQDSSRVELVSQGVSYSTSVASNSDSKIDFSNVFQCASQSLTSKPVRNVWEDGVLGVHFWK